VLVAFAQVADSLRALQSDAEALKAQNAAFQAARRNLDLVRHQLRQGAVDYLNLFNAQAQYQRVLISYTAAKLQRYRDTATLFRALGGGWWNLKGNSLDPRDIALAEPRIRAPSVTHQLGRL
jgi:outer membrane protein TolC